MNKIYLVYEDVDMYEGSDIVLLATLNLDDAFDFILQKDNDDRKDYYIEVWQNNKETGIYRWDNEEDLQKFSFYIATETRYIKSE